MLNQRVQQKNRCKTGRDGELKTQMETHAPQCHPTNGLCTALPSPSGKINSMVYRVKVSVHRPLT